MTDVTLEERVQYLEAAALAISTALEQTAYTVASLAMRLRHIEAAIVSTQQTPGPREKLSENPAQPSVPESGWLDVEAFVTGKVGTLDMRLSNQFGQMVARAAQSRGLRPQKIAHPGQFWETVNTWPIEFLREMWSLTYGGLNQ